MIIKTGKVKLGVYGSYKKGFHNHEMLGKDAKFLGMAHIKGAMYLVDIGKDPYPLFYLEPHNKTLLRDYHMELYEVDAVDYAKIQTKELKENGMAISAIVNKDDFTVFVTNPKDKTEPPAADYIKSFHKQKFEAYIGGEVTIHALDRKKAEEQLQELFDTAADTLEREKCEEASMIFRELSPYLRPEESPTEAKIEEVIGTA